MLLLLRLRLVGADNIGIYVPIFTQLSVASLIVVFTNVCSYDDLVCAIRISISLPPNSGKDF
jgi:cadmium resistance protein CadD (predicted permease)